jgi:hypothetical protein
MQSLNSYQSIEDVIKSVDENTDLSPTKLFQTNHIFPSQGMLFCGIIPHIVHALHSAFNFSESLNIFINFILNEKLSIYFAIKLLLTPLALGLKIVAEVMNVAITLTKEIVIFSFYAASTVLLSLFNSKQPQADLNDEQHALVIANH